MPSCAPGTELGHYRIVRLLGRGGMGAVYLARDLRLERDVAIKVLPGDDGDDDGTRKRVLREAQAAASLDHPGICAVHEVGEAPDGSAFIVMQYVEGETLATILERGPMLVRDALVLCAQVTEALSAAHKRGIVHRDLKPQNVIVTASGRPKLLDFGLAKVLPDPATASDTPTRSIETMGGVVRGTPGYMAPEQVQLRPIDGRADLFALGALMFECLTGQRAFDEDSALAIYGQILHVHPPAVSSLRPELTERHDELCRRLLAKDPADRFQSADEVTGALRLLIADSSRGAVPPGVTDAQGRISVGAGDANATGKRAKGRPAPRHWMRPAIVVAVIVLVAAAFTGRWMWNAWYTMPPVPPEAERWYQRGADAVRQGAYHSGQLALQEAVRLFPQYPLARARLAEALAELDDDGGAQAQLLQLASVLPNESRLPPNERLRLQGTRAHVMRDLDASLAAYRTLAERNPRDATSWLDLGRAQEAREGAGAASDARASYAKALAIDPQYAAARLRLAAVAAQESKRDEALAAFAESERLYRAATNAEGEAEVLLRRGTFRYALGDLKQARSDLERAYELASTLNGVHQEVRARMALSGVTAVEGNFTESERIASEAVQQALDAGLDTVAADGLVDLAATLMESARPIEAAELAERALQLAERRGARRTGARAQIQLAAIRLQQGRPRDALTLAEKAVAFVGPNKYRRHELFGLSVMSRAYQQLDDLDRARTISTEVVAAADALHDEVHAGIGLSNLALVATSLGQLPQALSYRERAEAIRRRQHDASALPYDLANRAELLIRLGRLSEASRVLDELETGIKAGIDAYVGRAPRAAFLRALAAVTALKPQDALRYLRMGSASRGTDSVSVLSPLLLAYATTRAGQRSATTLPTASTVSPALARERQYWLARVFLEQGNASAALVEADRGLQLVGASSNDELRWRLAALAALALSAQRDWDRARERLDVAEQALARLRSTWPSGFDQYEKRPDLAELKARLATATPSSGG